MMRHAPDGGELILRASATSAGQSHYRPSPSDRLDVLGAARVARSPRYGSQAYFWTESWQQAERLADFDEIAGMDFEPADFDDLIEWLSSDD